MILRSSQQQLTDIHGDSSSYRNGNGMRRQPADVLPLQHAQQSAEDSYPRTKGGAWFAGLFGFWCMNAYPSITFGNTTAITAGNVLTALSMVYILTQSWNNKPYFLYVILMLPLWTATASCALAGNGDASMCVKVDIMRTVAYATLLTAQYLFPIYSLEVLTGIAVACILHFIVGMWQLWAFQSHEFPLEWLYNNKSFLSVQDMTKTIARYIQRPFGIFPEPSAMSSSLAPFVVLWLGESCGLVRFNREPSKLQRYLFAAGTLGSLLLIIISRSGHTAVTLLPIIIFSLFWLKKCTATPRNVFILFIAIIVSVIVIWMGVEAMSDRLGGKSNVGNSSWEERSSSLIAGYEMVRHLGYQTMIFGIGPGNTSPLLYGMSQLEAVWSVILTYVYETGLIGLTATLFVGAYVLDIWRKVRYNIVLISILWVWFIGILLTTSYDQLQPIWLTLGLMTVWRSVCSNPIKDERPNLEQERLSMLNFKRRSLNGN